MRAITYARYGPPDILRLQDVVTPVPLGGLNALHFMRLAKIRAGEHVLVNGGGGSIGAHAVQIAKSMGAEVTAVDSRIKEPLVRRLGADHFIDYTAEDFTTSGRAYDVIMGMVPSGSCSARVNALRPNGRYFCGNPRLLVPVSMQPV